MKIYFAAGKSRATRIKIATALIWAALRIIKRRHVIMSVTSTGKEDVVSFRSGEPALFVTLDAKDEVVNIDNNKRLIVQPEEK